MGTRKNTFYHIAGLLILIAASGCTTTSGGPMGWMSPQSRQHESLAQKLSSQKNGINRGVKSSIYPAVMVQKEPIPSKEKDLKKPVELHLYYAKLQEQLGHLTVSRTFYDKVITKDPRSVDANIGLARLEAIAGHHAEAEKRFRKAIEIAPNSSEALFALGDFLSGQKRYTEAIVEMQKAVKQFPSSQYKFQIGLTLARSGQFDQSFATLSSLVGEAEAYYNIGYIALKELDDASTAERYFALSLDVDPDLEQSRYWLADLKSKQDRVIIASGIDSGSKYPVQRALNVERASFRNTGTTIPTTMPGNINIDGLTPEQLEQWKNQSELQ